MFATDMVQPTDSIVRQMLNSPVSTRSEAEHGLSGNQHSSRWSSFVIFLVFCFVLQPSHAARVILSITTTLNSDDGA